MKNEYSKLPLLEVNNLSIDIGKRNKKYALIENVNFSLQDGQVLGIVGESGSGKTITCLSLVKLLSTPPFLYQSGSVIYKEMDLWKLSEAELQRIRGSKISFIFQEAFSALNPVVKVGKQVAEVFLKQNKIKKGEAQNNTIKLFKKVGIQSPEIRYHSYPHQLSGGLQQRVMISMALASHPDILIADEPTTALDVTIQLQIIEELKKLQKESHMSVIFINHDLGLIAEFCDKVIVMYAGEIVEESTLETLFNYPKHPYTQLLLKSVPKINESRGKLTEIPGYVPSPKDYPSGCKFSPRCPNARNICQKNRPVRESISPTHHFNCWYPNNA